MSLITLSLNSREQNPLRSFFLNDYRQWLGDHRRHMRTRLRQYCWLYFNSSFQDIPTGAESCVTSIVSDSVGRTLLVVGCGDGSVRLFDRRLSPNDSRVMTMREHQSWVVNVVLEKNTSESIISARLGLWKLCHNGRAKRLRRHY